jgi:hypothetical protein
VRRVLFVLVVLAAAVVAPAASPSQLIDRNAQGVTLAVNTKGEALVTYTAAGKLKHVVAWGAVNAIAPKRGGKQVAFRLDYAGGWGKYHRDYFKEFKNACSRYDGPKLGWFVVGCKAPDGSYWALQSWQKMLPNYGVAPTSMIQSAWELHLSHWTGALPAFQIKLDWAWHQWDHLYGSFTYGGTGVFGFAATLGGNPLDTFGRNVYLDTFGSAYGAGWERENSFLTHLDTGAFCYSVNPHGSHPSGKGAKYRATVIGPGVTPDAFWQGNAPGAYDRAADLIANDEINQLGDSKCKGN